MMADEDEFVPDPNDPMEMMVAQLLNQVNELREENKQLEMEVKRYSSFLQKCEEQSGARRMFDNARGYVGGAMSAVGLAVDEDDEGGDIGFDPPSGYSASAAIRRRAKSSSKRRRRRTRNRRPAR